jgi:hypothetical protein
VLPIKRPAALATRGRTFGRLEITCEPHAKNVNGHRCQARQGSFDLAACTPYERQQFYALTAEEVILEVTPQEQQPSRPVRAEK